MQASRRFRYSTAAPSIRAGSSSVEFRATRPATVAAVVAALSAVGATVVDDAVPDIRSEVLESPAATGCGGD